MYLPIQLICPGSNHLIHNLPSLLSRHISNPQNVRTKSSFGVTQWVSSCHNLWLLCGEYEAALNSVGKPAFTERWCLSWLGVGGRWQVGNTHAPASSSFTNESAQIHRSRALLDLTTINQIPKCAEHSSLVITISILQINWSLEHSESHAPRPIGNKRPCQDSIPCSSDPRHSSVHHIKLSWNISSLFRSNKNFGSPK